MTQSALFVTVFALISLTACAPQSSDKPGSPTPPADGELSRVFVPEVADETELPDLTSLSPFRSTTDPKYKSQTSVKKARLDVADALFYNATTGIKTDVLIGMIDQGPIYPKHEDMKNVFHPESTSKIKNKNVLHAQFVAGILAARSFNGVGIRGVMGSRSQVLYLEASGPAEIATNIQKLAARGAAVINVSMGAINDCNTSNVIDSDGRDCQHPAIEDSRIAKAAREAMNTYNTIVVVAAGNNGDKIETRSVVAEGVIVVGASTADGYKKDFSSYGPGVSLFAIGDSVLGTGKSGYSYEEGTSFTTPIVSGAAALAVGYLRSNQVSYTPLDVKRLILASVVYSKRLKDKAEAGGHLDFGRLAESLKAFVEQSKTAKTP